MLKNVLRLMKISSIVCICKDKEAPECFICLKDIPRCFKGGLAVLQVFFQKDPKTLLASIKGGFNRGAMM